MLMYIACHVTHNSLYNLETKMITVHCKDEYLGVLSAATSHVIIFPRVLLILV